MKQLGAGDIVTFGRYPQTAIGDDSTPVEWLVLDRVKDRALLLSRAALDAGPYHHAFTSTAWKTCSLRRWLNGAFFAAAFNAREQSAIKYRITDNGKAQGDQRHSTPGTPDTRDRVFLLSFAQAFRYFTSDSARVCAATEYARTRGAETDPDTGTCWWWLRSPGPMMNTAAAVYFDGCRMSDPVTAGRLAIRPALWADPKRL